MGKRFGGRTKGTPNRITQELREMIEGALSDLGGRAWLVTAAQEKPAAFLALIGKLLPKDIVIDKPDRSPSEMSDAELEQGIRDARDEISRALKTPPRTN